MWSGRQLSAVTIALVLTGCGEPFVPQLFDPVPSSAKVPEEVVKAVTIGEPTRVLVVFEADEPQTAGGIGTLSLADLTRRALRSADLKQDLFATAPSTLVLDQDYEQLPITLATVSSAEGLRHLLDNPRVLRVMPDQINTTSLATSLPMISQPDTEAEGKDGTGTAVAVLDTGADYTVSDLGSCTAVGTPSSCRVVYAQDFAANDGLRDDSGKHGTNVSSIVARVAPGTKIIALDVFDGASGYDSTIINAINWVIANRTTYNIVAMNLSLGGGSYTASCGSAPMAVALAEARQAGILAAVATGNSATTNAIASPACAPAAVSVGAVYDSNVGTLNSAVCSDSSTMADRVSCFSNSASFMTLLAPGTFITAGGVTMAGTSQASPHVAGALAVLRGAFPSETPDEIVARMVNTGESITDYRNAIVKPRLNLHAAASGCVFQLTPSTKSLDSAEASFSVTLTTSASCNWTANPNAAWLTVTSGASGTGSATLTIHADQNSGALRSGTITLSGDGSSTGTISVSQGVDTTAPTGTVSINADAAYTKSTTVGLTISGSDASDVTHMCVTNGTTCTTFEAFATSKVFTLTNTVGTRTVTVFLKDSRGNVTSATAAPKDTIILDNVVPTGGAAIAAVGDASVTVSWGAGSDALSGIGSYKVVYATGTTSPSNCSTGTVAYEGSATSFSHTGLTNGTSYAYRVCAVDRAGNMSTGSVASARPRPESDGPVGALTINGGATYTRSTAISLTLSPTDASAVTQVCLSSTATCTAWTTFASTKSFTLPNTQGTRTVYATFKDTWGNTSAAVAQASIVLDSVVPSTMTATSSYGDGTVTVSWTASTDLTSGLDSYKVVYATGTTAPANCSTGTVAYAGTSTSFTHSSLTNGTRYSYRVCALDRAGNMNAGAITSAQPRPESDGPVGALTINGGATYTRSTAVALTLSPTDASAVTQVCLSSTATCTAWTAFAATKSFTLPNTQGTRTVYATFKDTWGNTSAAVAQASIVLDSVVPSAITATSSYGDGTVTVSWSATTDVTSGLDKYKVVYATGTTSPANCSTGTVGYEGTSTSFTHSSLTNGTRYSYRVCALDKAGNMNTGAITSAQPRPESDGPVGALTINGGATYTRSTAVTLTLSPTDASTVTQVCLSSTATCTAWTTFASTKSFTLPNTQGTRTVYASFKDTWGNTSAAVAQASIVLDSVVPSAMTATSSFADGTVTVSWSAATDITSGLDKYKLVYATGTTSPANCSTGTVAYEGTSTSFTHSSLTNGTRYSYRVCALDKAGNVNAGAITSAQPRPESDGPVGALTINGGATYTRSTAVTLTLSPTDASTVTQVCLSSTATCTSWTAFASTKSFTLPNTQGTRTVYASFKDTWGNVSSAAAQASIILDSVVPSAVTLTGTAGSKQVALSWSGASDSGSGIASYKLVMLPGTTLPSAQCTTGTTLQPGTQTSFTHTSLTAGATYSYRLCTIDNAGNVSTGSTAAVKPLP